MNDSLVSRLLLHGTRVASKFRVINSLKTRLGTPDTDVQYD